MTTIKIHWREKDHPREPKGTPGGGQFAAKGKSVVVRLKFSANQPRVPAGDPRGGQWTSGSGGNYGGYNEPQGFMDYRRWRQGRQENMEPKTPVLPGRPGLIWGSPLSGDTGLNPDERKMIESYFQEFESKLPDWYGTDGTYTSIKGRHKTDPPGTSRATGHASPDTIYIDVQVFAERSPDKIKRILAHEIGHTVQWQNGKMAQAFRNIYGTGPYKSGTAGVTSIYHLQNERELFSKLTERYFVDNDAPKEFVNLWGTGS